MYDQNFAPKIYERPTPSATSVVLPVAGCQPKPSRAAARRPGFDASLLFYASFVPPSYCQ